jgi:hypothetical protein
VNNKPGSAQKRVGFLIPRETARKFCALIARRHIIPNQNPKFRNPKLHIWHPKPETRQSQQRSAGFHASGRERARFEGSLQPQKILALVKGVAGIVSISESSRINKILAKIRFRCFHSQTHRFAVDEKFVPLDVAAGNHGESGVDVAPDRPARVPACVLIAAPL